MKKIMFLIALAIACAGGLARFVYAESGQSEVAKAVVANVDQQMEQKTEAKDRYYIYKYGGRVGEIINLKPANN